MKKEVYRENLSDELEEIYDEGVSELEIGKFENAEEKIKKVLEAEPEFVPGYNKLGVIALYKKNQNEAEKWLNRALEIDDEFVPSITNIGSLEKKRGNLEKAEKLYEKAVMLDPDYGPAHNNLGVIYREKGNYAKSVKHLKKARKLGSYAVELSDKPLLQRKGCLVPLGLVIFFAILFFLWLY
ncbi:MAG: tetratricopeptide repeat protein [Bacillota bacterium]